MGYFPFFMDIEGKKGLIVGGGMIALRKAEKLLPFGPDITVAAPDILRSLAALPGLTVLERPFDPSMLEGVCFAIAATDDHNVNRAVSTLCQERDIPVNVVDDPDACTFLFPALVKDGPLCVGVCTEGASPTAAAWLRGEIEGLLPENIADILEYLRAVRPSVKKDRVGTMKKLLAACLQTGRPLNKVELDAILEEGE